jgi:fructose-specific phosphotransferase system component IIB
MKSILFTVLFIGVFIAANAQGASELRFAGKKHMENITLSELKQCEKLILKSESPDWQIESAYVTIWAKDGKMEERQMKAEKPVNEIAFTKELCEMAAETKGDVKIFFDSVKLLNKTEQKSKTVTFFVMVVE